MILKFCICEDDPRKVDKSLTEVHSVNNAAIYQACSIMAPEFVVDYREDLLACNYVVTGIGVSQSGRAYFIKEHIVLPGGRLVIRCAIDVLNTWKTYIKECSANVIRQENKSPLFSYIPDGKMVGKVSTLSNVIDAKYTDHSLRFSLPTTASRSYLLTVIGGDHNPRPTEGS